MKRVTTFVAPVVALAMAVTATAKAEASPYADLAQAMGTSICLVNYGYARDTAKQAFDLTAQKYSETAVKNIMSDRDFQKRTADAVKELGGCEAIADNFHKLLEEEMQRREKS